MADKKDVKEGDTIEFYNVRKKKKVQAKVTSIRPTKNGRKLAMGVDDGTKVVKFV